MKCVNGSRRAVALTCVAGLLALSSATAGDLPYERVGLDDREAAAFLLDRLTYGPGPRDVDRVLAVGIERWLDQQLAGTLRESTLAERLEAYDALGMTHAELARRYPNSSQMSAHLRRFQPGLIPGRDEVILDFSVVSAKMDEFRAANGYLRQEVDLHAQLLGQKIERAVYAENQLREVLTDFWQNHFYTSPENFNARMWILPFENEALRPNALGTFRELLGAVARHPAMRRYYVGNEVPAEIGPGDSTMDMILAAKRAEPGAATVADAMRARAESEIVALEYDDDLILSREFWPKTGPNPAYARALVALQTLGPGSDYTDADLDAVAQVFTGWSYMPVGPSAEWYERGFRDALKVGFVHDGSFVFRADQHDARPKQAFGLAFPAGGGLEEGEAVLDYLAGHEDTARHIATKLATRFVDETPEAALVDRLTDAFIESRGDIAEVMRTVVESPEFWRAAHQRTKVKTPLEFAASALRALEADIEAPDGIASWLARMGQPLYAFLETTGYPDKGAYWLDSASIIQRLNFAESLTRGAIDGVSTAPPAAESIETMAEDLMPGRDIRDSVTELEGTFGPAEAEHSQELIAALLLASPSFQMR